MRVENIYCFEASFYILLIWFSNLLKRSLCHFLPEQSHNVIKIPPPPKTKSKFLPLCIGDGLEKTEKMPGLQ